MQTQHHRLSPRKTSETIRSWGVNAKERETGQCSWWRDPTKRKVLFLNVLWDRGGSPSCLPEFFIADPGARMQIKLTWPSPLSVLSEYPALGRGALQHCLLSQGGSLSQTGAWWPLRQKEKTPGLRPLGQISPAFYLEGHRAPTFCLSCASCQRPSKQKLYSCEVLWKKKYMVIIIVFFFSVQ